MIDNIYILTVNRPDNQITFNNLSEKYQKKVVMVVQAWEREKYSYPCEYLVLPEDYHFTDYLCLPKTRRLVMEVAQNQKYCMFDDDLKFWANGKAFQGLLPELPSAPVMAGEDVFFLLTLLSRGYYNRVSEEFVHTNVSNNGKIASTIWDRQTYEKTLNDHLILEKAFPGVYSIVYNDSGKRAEGGYRNFGKSKIEWSKAFKITNKRHNSLARFLE